MSGALATAWPAGRPATKNLAKGTAPAELHASGEATQVRPANTTLRELRVSYQIKTDEDGRPIVVQRAAAHAAFVTLLTKILDDEPNEVLGMLCLTTTHSVVAYHEISRGTLDGTRVSPRDVFKVALLANAAAIVLGHNHPSGDPTPSSTDISVTRRLAQVGRLIGVEVLDHIVVADGQHASLQEHCRPPHLAGRDDDQRPLEHDAAVPNLAIERHPKTTALPRTATKSLPPTAPAATASEFLNFDRLLDRLLAVPRSVVTERIDAHRRQSANNPRRRGPKPKVKS
jgi:DNA repair protein RadC